MKVLMQSRANLFSVPGGDTVQIMKTKEYLEKLGVGIDVCTTQMNDLSQYDLVHIFNLMRPQETYLQVKNAKKQGKKVLLSTIYGLYTEYDRKARSVIYRSVANVLNPWQIEYLKILVRVIKNAELHRGTIHLLLKGYRHALKETVDLVDFFLPNSESEMRRVAQDFGLSEFRYKVTPNSVDIQLFDPENTGVPASLKEYEGCILCVARIEGRKSQLNLVKAVKDLPFKLLLVGRPAPNHRKYYAKVKKAAGDNVVFIDHMSHESLPGLYKVAKVHVLPSWMETPGLSSLEAGIMGCNLVVTEKGDTREYFGDNAYYCEPDSVESIGEAVKSAYEAPVKRELLEHIRRNFSWESTASRTIEAYNQLLGNPTVK